MSIPEPLGLSPSLLFSLVFALVLTAAFVTRLWLANRQARHVAAHRSQVPAAFAAHVGLSAHQKAADYTLAKLRLGILELALGTALTLGWTLLGGLNALHQGLLSLMGPGLAQQLCLLAAFTFIGSLFDLPFSWWSTFVIDERFGFNRSTLRLWLSDLLKATALGVALGLPLAALILWVMAALPASPWWQSWWFVAWSIWTAFNLLLLWIFPTFIAPLFNRFEPLADENLRQRVTALMERCGFQASGLFVMDGSRRSAHANAYFTGMGRSKRVVFYDTLLQRLTPEEVDAVLAHELGHFRKRHVTQRMLMMFGASLLGFAVLGWLAGQAWFYTGLGATPMLAWTGNGDPSGLGGNEALALLLMMLALPPFMFFIGPLAALGSRRHEYEADAFAAGQTRAADLASALLKLYEDNASTLTPDPWYVRFYHSHPPALQRLEHLRGLPEPA